MRSGASSRTLQLDNKTRRHLRRISHHLHPVIIVGDGGVSDGVIGETNRALEDHELIKVKINAADRDSRSLLGDALLEACGAEAIQKIGKVIVLYRHNAEANAELSNVTRAGIGRA